MDKCNILIKGLRTGTFFSGASYMNLNNFIYIITSSIMCALGLLYNSNAVVLGSMLVSPIGSPIFRAISGIITNDSKYLGLSIFALVILVSFSYLIGVLIGLINKLTNYFVTPTDEMDARVTVKRIITDIIIALVAGFTIAVASFNKNIVVIAGINLIISFLPPLVNSGLYHGFELYNILRARNVDLFEKIEKITKLKNYELKSDPKAFEKGNTSFILGMVNIIAVLISGALTLIYMC
jgi:hypothetical protein